LLRADCSPINSQAAKPYDQSSGVARDCCGSALVCRVPASGAVQAVFPESYLT